MYLEIFGVVRWLRIGSILGLVVTTMFYIGTFVSLIVLSTPAPGMTWLEQQSTSRAKHEIDYAVPQAAVGLVIDLYVLLLPIVVVSRLQLPLRRKIGVILIFMTGIGYVARGRDFGFELTMVFSQRLYSFSPGHLLQGIA